MERLERLAGWQPLERRNAYLDHEAAAALEVGRDVLEAGDLLVLGCQIVDRIEDEIGERERPLDPGRGEVADCYVDLLGTRLCPQPRQHRRGELDSVHADTTARERQRDPAGADSEFERGAVAGQLRQEVDYGIDDRGLGHVGEQLVVSLCNGFAKVVFGHGRILTNKPEVSSYHRRGARPVTDNTKSRRHSEKLPPDGRWAGGPRSTR